MSEQETRKAGRPPKQMKKGNTSWKPASVLDVSDKDPNKRYRWVTKTPDNQAKKMAEGWEPVSGLQSDKAEHSSNRIHDGAALTSVLEKHDCVLMSIPEEMAQERDAYFNQQSQRQVAGLTAHVKKELGKEGAVSHGNITISSLKGEQIIE
jgi:hypothetical protein